VKITSERLPESRVLLEIEVDPERLEKAMNQAYRRVVTRARIPGFRPGKAPRAMVERYLGRETLLQEALDKLVPEVYEEAIEQEGIHPIDQPDLEMPQLDPVVVKATVPVRPTIDLGDYRSLRLDPEPVTLDEHVVDETIEQLQHRYATVEPVDRPVELGDLVRADLKTTADGEVYFDHKDAEFAVTTEDTTNLPGLAEGLVGMTRGEQREFSVDVPEDSAGTTLAGKHVTYEATIHEIKVEHLPELNDEFAGMVGEGFATMEALRAKLYADAQQRAENEAKRGYEQKVLDALVTGATFEYPPVLIEREIDRLIRERTQLGDQRPAFERYLAAIGKTEQEYRDQFREEAAERVRRSLALSHFTEEEGLSATDADVDAEINEMIGDAGESADRIREIFGSESGRDVIERSVITRKAYDRLADIAGGKEVPPKPEKSSEEQTQTPAAESEIKQDSEPEDSSTAEPLPGAATNDKG
jgi:trigger factor